ncbi:MAG: diguanylate cyclase domain-containing protein [Nodosilinea sp.]
MELTIVCVDDDCNILQCLGSQLKRNFGKDHDILLASSGNEALLLCKDLTTHNENIALIISDQNMPDMDGDTLLIQLHTLYPKALKIMLTGQAEAAAIGNVVNQGALYRYISKPWNETDLVLTVTEALRRFQQEQCLLEKNELLQSANVQLEKSLSILSATLEATADGILVVDNNGKILNSNQRFFSLFGLDRSAFFEDQRILLKKILSCLEAPDSIKLKTILSSAENQGQDCLKLKNDLVLEYYLHPYEVGGQQIGNVLNFRDVTQAHKTAAMMRHQAFHDVLTDLPNRVLFNEKLAERIQETADSLANLAVMFLDLDHFKEINDTFGHAVGDLLLQHVVQRLLRVLQDIDTIARWGGDEFVLLLPQIQCAEDAGKIARRLIKALQPVFYLQEYSVQITASIGIAIYPDDGLDPNTLLLHADKALYLAKEDGRNSYQLCSGLTSTARHT